MTLLSSRYRIWGRPGARGPDEVEALQTDVMRFMAILGFCLMVIFALVKTMPMAPPDSRPKIEAQKPMSLMPETHSPEARSPQAHSPKAHSPKAHSPKAHSPEAPRPQAPLQQAQSLLKKQGGPGAAPAVRPETDPIPYAREEQGFILRFSSESGLQSLIAAGEVGFYAMAGNKAWRLKISPGGPLFVVADGPASFYEMAPETVPGPYIRALEGKVAAFGPRTMIWGVTLPERTRAGIHHQMNGKPGGTLAIQEDGSVICSPGRAETRGYP